MMLQLVKSVNPRLIAQIVLAGLVVLPIRGHAGSLDDDLRKAAEKGQIQKVASLFHAGASVNSADKKGRTALILAAEKGHLEVVRLLVAHAANISSADNNGATALDKAVKNSNNDIVIFLKYVQAKEANTTAGYDSYLREYPSGPYVSEINKSRECVSFEDAKKENTTAGYDKYLAEYPSGIYVSEANKLRQKRIDEVETERETRRAVISGDVLRLKQLMTDGADVTGPDLMNEAVSKGFKDMVELLITHGSKAHLTKMLYLAARGGQMEIAKLLKQYGAGLRGSSNFAHREFLNGQEIAGDDERGTRIVDECERCLKAQLARDVLAEFILIDQIESVKLDVDKYNAIRGMSRKCEVYMMVGIGKNGAYTGALLGKCVFGGLSGMSLDSSSSVLSRTGCLPEFKE